MCRVLRKLGIMHVRKVSSQISLCSSHKVIKDDTFCLNWIFAKKRLHLKENCHFVRKVSSLISLCKMDRLIWDKTLRKSIMPIFSKHHTHIHESTCILHVITYNFWILENKA